MTTPTEMRRVGQSSTWTATFRNDDGVLINPDTVTFRVKPADEAGEGTAYVYGADDEVIRPSTGVYQFRAPAYTTSTRYVVGVFSTGPDTAEEQTVDVLGSAFTPVAP